MKLTIGNSEALASAVEFSDNEIVFLFGSPLSASSGETVGIPGVRGVLDIIENRLSEKPKLFELYRKNVDSSQPDTDRYQSSFDFLSMYTSPNTVNGIIRSATLQAYKGDVSDIDINDVPRLMELQNDVSNWSIPPATKSLSEILLNFEKASKIALTPNFDPLLSIALEQASYKPARVVLHGDSNLEQFQSSNVNVIHFHGFWVDTDTLHTPAQLTLDRPLLKQSLTRILSNKTLVVLGYGGWDDIFTQVLFSMISDSGANFDILWAFFESQESTIKEKYQHLLESVAPAIQRGRFKIYGGIDCHSFLPQLSEALECDAAALGKSLPVTSVIAEKHAQINEQEFEDRETALTPWSIFLEPAHRSVRVTERSYLIRLLENNRYVNVEAEWGISHREFVYSLTLEEKSQYFNSPIFRIDLAGVRNKKEIFERIERETGVSLQVFIQKLPKCNSIVFFDDVGAELTKSSDIARLVEDLESLLSIMHEYNEKAKVLLVSRKRLTNNFPVMQLSKLEDYDAKEFILNHSSIRDKLDRNAIDTVIELGKGIPSSIERCIQDLNLLSSEELYEEHYTPESRSWENEGDFPTEIINRVEQLAASQELHSKRSYQLLETLAVLEFGDTFYNLRRTNPDATYRKTHLDELHNLELVEATNLTKNIVEVAANSGETKILKLPSAVRNYVYGKLSTKKVYEISKNIAKVHLGDKWRTGKVQLCQLTKEQIRESDKVSGSTHILLAQLLKCSIELDLGRDIDSAIRACRSYCKQISSAARYKEVISFSKHIRAIARESDKVGSLSYFNMLEGASLRMTSKHEEAEPLLLAALMEKEHLTNNEIVQVLLNLMFMYDSLGELDEAIRYAKQALEIEPKNSDALLKLEELSDLNEIQKLKNLEQKFRNNNKTVTANNAALAICDLETSYKSKVYWLNRILASHKDQYNQMRAITKKALLEPSGNYSPSAQELRLLHTCYIFSFSQGMDRMFNDSHKLLWNHYKEQRNYGTVFNLYRHSSLYWRLYGFADKELQYSNEIKLLVANLLPEAIDLSKYENAYVIHRVQILAQD